MRWHPGDGEGLPGVSRANGRKTRPSRRIRNKVIGSKNLLIMETSVEQDWRVAVTKMNWCKFLGTQDKGGPSADL